MKFQNNPKFAVFRRPSNFVTCSIVNFMLRWRKIVHLYGLRHLFLILNATWINKQPNMLMSWRKKFGGRLGKPNIFNYSSFINLR